MLGIMLYQHQMDAVKKIHDGCVVLGGVGCGKTITSLSYVWLKVFKGGLQVNGVSEWAPPKNPMPLYIITTARKRDTEDWEKECAPFLITKDPKTNKSGIPLHVDSWNNIQKYVDVKDAYFIFDEQRAIGYGKWSKSFIKIAKQNRWIMLSATPGDTWSDYIPLFIANGYFKNKTEFVKKHAVYSRYSKYPKIDHYVNEGQLLKYKKDLLIEINFERETISHVDYIRTDYDKMLYQEVNKQRWNPFTKEPMKDAGELCRVLRKIVNSSPDRLIKLSEIYLDHPRLIIFYNYNFELELLVEYCQDCDIPFAQWNGRKHEMIPDTDHWIYLVQYTAGAEGWNCIKTDTLIFYSDSYSYKQMIQAAGRIDRMNTPYKDLYYYHFVTKSSIDAAIQNALKKKKSFNEKKFAEANNFSFG